MRISYNFKRIILLLIILPTLAVSAAAASGDTGCSLVPVSGAGIEFSEFSGICYDNATGTYYAVSDEPKGKAGNQLFRVRYDDGEAVVTKAFPLRRNGAAVDGLYDLEGIAIDSSGNLYICAERRLVILKTDKAGNILDEIKVPARVVDIANVVFNGGIEGVSLTPDEEALFMVFEKPLIGGDQNKTLLLEYSLKSGEFTKYFIDLRGDTDKEGRNYSISDIFAVSDSELVIIVHDNSRKDSSYKKLFTVTVTKRGATKKLLLDFKRYCNYTLKKPEGLCINGSGDYVITNDAEMGGAFLLIINYPVARRRRIKPQ